VNAALDLPDVPRWVEAHGIAGDPAHWRRPIGRGFALGHDAARLVVLVGEVEPAGLASLPATHTVLFAIEREDVRAALSRPVKRAVLHTLDGDPPELEGAVVLPNDAALPDYLAAEFAWARTRGPIFTVYVDGVASAFAYAPWRSAMYFDVSVDVIPSARQLGLATLVASAMIAAERTQGREPVWGADEGNAASIRLAKRLGFTPVDEVWVAPAS
jgi:RimJ/RimL family protein N-acetyltransferase